MAVPVGGIRLSAPARSACTRLARCQMPPGRYLRRFVADEEGHQGFPSGAQPQPAQYHLPGQAVHHQAQQAHAHPQEQPQPSLGVRAELDQLTAVAQQGRHQEAHAQQGDPEPPASWNP